MAVPSRCSISSKAPALPSSSLPAALSTGANDMNGARKPGVSTKSEMLSAKMTGATGLVAHARTA